MNNLEIARKEILPILNVAANLNIFESCINDFFSLENFSASLLTSTSGIIYDNGNRKREIDRREIFKKQALLSYESTLLSAIQTVESLLVLQKENLRQESLLQLQQESQERVKNITQVKYNTGSASAFDLITEQNAALFIRQQRLNIWLSGMINRINIVSEFGINPDVPGLSKIHALASQ